MLEEIKTWFNALIHPTELITKESGKSTWEDAFKRVILAGFLAGLVSGFFIMLFQLAAGKVVTAIIGWIIAMIVGPITAVIGWIIGAILLFITAKLLGGKADFARHTTDLTWYYAPITFVTGIISWIPLIGQALGALIWLYGLYPLTMIIKVSHGLSTEKAVVVWLIWVIIGIIIAIIAAVALFAFIASIKGMIPTIPGY